MLTYRILKLLTVWLMLWQPCIAQQSSFPKSCSFGIHAGHWGRDAGIGIEIGSASFFRNKLFLRAKGNVVWSEDYKAAYDHWINYKVVSISALYNVATFERGRAYFEVGPYFLFPNRRLSNDSIVQGLAGTTGIELLIISSPGLNVSYYFACGIGYCKAYADKVEDTPRYGNGLLVNSGFRFYL